MKYNSTESWLFMNTSFSILPVTTSPANISMEAYLQRLAHLDEGLYNDFYGLWITLMVINSLIFLVGVFGCLNILLLFRNSIVLANSCLILLYCISPSVFQVGMVLNTVALYVFCYRTKQKTTSVIYTINLAVTDLLVNLSLPTRILLYYSGGTCLTCSYMHIFSYFVNMYCSILFLTCICVDRYLAIVQVCVAGCSLA